MSACGAGIADEDVGIDGLPEGDLILRDVADEVTDIFDLEMTDVLAVMVAGSMLFPQQRRIRINFPAQWDKRCRSSHRVW